MLDKMNFAKINLTRPLVTMDIESTGTDTQTDRIVSLAMYKQIPGDLMRKEDVYQFYSLFNPGREMSDEVIAVHGITNADVADKPNFEQRAGVVYSILQGCDLCGFNIVGFDIPILWEEFYRAGIEWDLDGINIIDCAAIFKKQEPRDLTAAVKFYCGRDREGAHNAMADVQETLAVLGGQIAKYPELSQMSIPQLAEFSQMDKRVDLAGVIVRDDKGVPRFTHKKVRGVAVIDDIGYAHWILRSGFSENTKRAVRKVLEEIGGEDVIF